MEKEDIHIIKAKIVISLNRLLENLRESIKEGNIIEDAEVTYEKIAEKCLIRIGTVNDTFNGNTSPSSVNLIGIIKGMGYKLSDFSAEYDSISDEEAKNYVLPRPKEERE